MAGLVQLILPVPNVPGPGPWVAASDVGPLPEGQLNPSALAADLVSVETAATPAAIVGKELMQFAGGQPSKNLSQSDLNAQYSGTGLKPLVFGYLRAVRKAGPTLGLNLNITSSNLNAQGQPGPPGGSPVSGTIITDGVGGIVLQPGGVGIAAVAIVLVGRIPQVQVTFATPFGFATYPVAANWWPTAGPGFLLPIGFATPPTFDGRTLANVTFILQNYAAAIFPPTVTPATIMLRCG